METSIPFLSPRGSDGNSGTLPLWSQSPIPGVSLGAGGLLALADLSTVAERTALAGGASWLDALLLAPGLHYQQAADALVNGGGETASVVGSGPGRASSAVSESTAAAGLRRRGGDGGGPGLGSGSDMWRHDLVVRNAATASYLRRISRAGTTVTLGVGCILSRGSRDRGLWGRILGRSRKRKDVDGDGDVDCLDDIVAGMQNLGWVSHLLYLASPVLTVVAIIFMVLFKDFWGLAAIIALITSRILNIIVVNRRTVRAPPRGPHSRSPFLTPSHSPHDPEASTDSTHEEDETPSTYLISLPCPPTSRRAHTFPPASPRNEDTGYASGLDTPATWGGRTPNPAGMMDTESLREVIPSGGITDRKASSWPQTHHLHARSGEDSSSHARILLRGRPSDLHAITTTPFLRPKTNIEGYLEAVAKLCVYMVASLSGNITQAGAIILMALLLTSAALLGLSNAHARSMKVNGRVAMPSASRQDGKSTRGVRGQKRGGRGMWVPEAGEGHGDGTVEGVAVGDVGGDGGPGGDKEGNGLG